MFHVSSKAEKFCIHIYDKRKKSFLILHYSLHVKTVLVTTKNDIKIGMRIEQVINFTSNRRTQKIRVLASANRWNVDEKQDDVDTIKENAQRFSIQGGLDVDFVT